MRVAVQKLPGVESVVVSLNRGSVRAQLKPGNRLQLKQLRTAVTDQGFTPQGAKITAVGDLSASGGKLRFNVGGTGDVFEVVEATDAKWQAGIGVHVVGIVTPHETDKKQDRIKIETAATKLEPQRLLFGGKLL